MVPFLKMSAMNDFSLLSTKPGGVTPRAEMVPHSNNALNEDLFMIERSLDSNSGFDPIAWVGADTTTYTDTALLPGTTYYYRVYAQNPYGDSDYSNIASATAF